MSNNIRAAWLNPARVLPASDPKRILRDHDLSFRAMYNYKSPGRAGSIEQKPIHTVEQNIYYLNCEGPPPSPTSRAQLAPAAVSPDVESSLQF